VLGGCSGAVYAAGDKVSTALRELKVKQSTDLVALVEFPVKRSQPSIRHATLFATAYPP
jgi:hypothetical protein